MNIIQIADRKTLDELLETYWDAAYAEGKGRHHFDTESAIAQKTLLAIYAEFDRIAAIQREKDAKICEQQDEDGEGPDCWDWHSKDYAKAIRRGDV